MNWKPIKVKSGWKCFFLKSVIYKYDCNSRVIYCPSVLLSNCLKVLLNSKHLLSIFQTIWHNSLRKTNISNPLCVFYPIYWSIEPIELINKKHLQGMCNDGKKLVWKHCNLALLFFTFAIIILNSKLVKNFINFARKNHIRMLWKKFPIAPRVLAMCS